MRRIHVKQFIEILIQCFIIHQFIVVWKIYTFEQKGYLESYTQRTTSCYLQDFNSKNDVFMLTYRPATYNGFVPSIKKKKKATLHALKY